MKAEIVAPPAPEPVVQITMTKREAKILRCLVGGIGLYNASGSADTESSRFVTSVWKAITDAEVDPYPESYSDFFDGSVRIR